MAPTELICRGLFLPWGQIRVDTVFLDLETFYSTEYSLRKMDPPSYILDPRFEVICAAVAVNNRPGYIVDGVDFARFLKDLPRNVVMVSHNQLFDACVLSWQYGWVADMMVDTLALSRTLLGHKLRSHSLKKVAEHLGLPPKGEEILRVQGWSRSDIIANGRWEAFTNYCLNDTELCREIYRRLAPQMPTEELLLHDTILRCAVEPALRLNSEVLSVHLADERRRKELVMAKAMLAGVDSRADLMSNDRFAKVLTNLGVDPPRKISQTTGLGAWAFAKTDEDFTDLLDHPDERVQAVVMARLGVKTTGEETRTERMLNIGTLDFPHHGGTGVMPIPLKIGAAHTHRLGGDWRLNCQNWGRGSPIRKAVVTPPGYRIVVADSAQIEARMNAWYCGQQDLVAQFARGEDVYSNFASQIFRMPVTKSSDPGKRFVGKTGILQLGYQSGWPKFQATVALLSGKDGNKIELTDHEAQFVVDSYRSLYGMIAQKWRWLSSVLSIMVQSGPDQLSQDGPIQFGNGRIVGPNGLEMRYHNLRYDHDAQQYLYSYGGFTHKIYGGKLLENIIQFLARVAVMQVAVRMRKPALELGARLVHTAHDELVYIAPDETTDMVQQLLKAEMMRTPDWAPGLPLSCDINNGTSYGEVK